MKNKILYSVLGLLTAILVGIGIFDFIINSENAQPERALESEMNKMISKKDYKQMKKVSVDQKTYKLLKKLPSKTNIKDTTDSQGGSKNIDYRVTNVTVRGKEKSFGVTMRKNKHGWKSDSVQKWSEDK